MPLVTFATVTIISSVLVAYLYLQSIEAFTNEEGLQFVFNGSQKAVKPIVLMWSVYTLHELGVSVSGVVSGIEALLSAL